MFKYKKGLFRSLLIGIMLLSSLLEAVVPNTPGEYIGVTGIDESSVRVNFLDNSNNEEGFLLFDESGDINITIPKNSSIAPSQTYVTLKGLESNRTYSIRVLAFNSNGNSIISDARTFNINSTFAKKNRKITAWYSDPLLERSLVIDLKTMQLLADIPSTGENTYNVDILDRENRLNKVFVMTRGSNSVDVIDTTTLETKKTIELQHYPRSVAYNSILGLMLISGKNKAMSSLIDVKTEEVVMVVGEDRVTSPSDFGGSNATGHPIWFSVNQFGLIDREKRTVELFKIEKKDNGWSIKSQDKIKTPTSIHHIVRERNLYPDMSETAEDFQLSSKHFYGALEGSPKDKIAPGVIEIILADDKLIVGKKMDIGFDESITKGIHHISFHPTNKELLYVPSKEGTLYVVNYKKMKVESTIKTGKGSGHITFVPKRDLAIVTNHNDTFISIIDSKTDKLIKNIEVSGDAINNTILQSHTQYVDKDENFFYAFASDNGKFYELDLEKLIITRTLYTGGTPKQGGFIKISK